MDLCPYRVTHILGEKKQESLSWVIGEIDWTHIISVSVEQPDTQVMLSPSHQNYNDNHQAYVHSNGA
jgi:hypothetical protein